MNHVKLVDDSKEEVKDEVEEAEAKEEVVVLKEEEEEGKEEEVVVEEMVAEEMDEVEELLVMVPLTITLTPVDVIPAKAHLVTSMQRESQVPDADAVEAVEDSMMMVDVVVDEFRSVLELEREEDRVKFNRGGVR